ncbi:hypothetical protein FJZ19_03280 [Candidatus Pacearchaeota archaeon]|nr:hypothetical protein [Candidatus Pacearchaeota archaeon]
MISILPLVLGFGLIFWIMIFLESWRHFPRMNKEERLWHAIESATTVTLILIAIVLLLLWFILNNFFLVSLSFGR